MIALPLKSAELGTQKSVIIACPSCGARFNLDPAKLLPAGRKVRCAKCDHRWRQMPEGAATPPPAPEIAPPPAPPPAPAQPPVAEPEPAAPPPEQPAAAAPAEEAEPHAPSPPETPAEMAQSLAAIAEQVAGARPEGYSVSEAPPRPEPNPIARLARRTAPGPITVPPRMRPMRPARRGSHLGLLLVAGLAIGLLITAYAFRDLIARTVPGADVVYALFGLATDNPAADLEISIDNARINTDQATGSKIFDLKATVFNLSEYPVDMPPLMVIPVDEAGSPLEPRRFRLAERVVEPGQNISFRKSFADWPPGAPNFELRLADAE